MQPDFQAKTRPSPVITMLSCGCKTRSRLTPHPNALLGCTSGLGHGYRLSWVWAEENGRRSYRETPEGKEQK